MPSATTITRQENLIVSLPGAVGDQGTTFLTGSAILSHLEDGERLSLVPVDVEFLATERVHTALLELQQQHRDMVVLLQDQGIDGSSCEGCEPDDPCIQCGFTAMFDRWEASRVG